MHLDYDPDDLDVKVSELLVATSDATDAELPGEVSEVLRLLRERLDMDVVFVSQISHGRRTFKVVESRPEFTIVQAGMSDPVEESWCQRVVEGRLPEVMVDARPFVAAGEAPDPGFEIGTHLSTPVRLADGSVYGTLCCFSGPPTKKAGAAEMDINRLRYTASLLAAKLKPTPLELQKDEQAGFKGTL